MPGSFAGRDKTKMPRVSRRIVHDAMVVHIERHHSSMHHLRWNTHLLSRLWCSTILEFKRHIGNGIRRRRSVHKGNVVDLQGAGKGEANRSLRLWHLKRQPVL